MKNVCVSISMILVLVLPEMALVEQLKQHVAKMKILKLRNYMKVETLHLSHGIVIL